MKNQVAPEVAWQLSLITDLSLRCCLLLIVAVVFFLAPAITIKLSLR